ncbi:SEC-C metal-binding domain-containing protein [Sporosarcina sp. FSL W7-1349]|uniref:SEC-C metal-binding domain-containing protein n=1 Tax=Sporosarcina sp. FSL W7-1349 TaxID=2921561 RepID=UPI0030FAE59A
MIGRNDPCPCGSGKKYKKCCALKETDPVEALTGEELNRIITSVYEHPPTPADMAEFEKYRRQWLNRLDKSWGREEIEEAVSEYFLFIARSDIWKRHLVRTSNSPIRETVRSVLDVWKNPFVLFGKVIGEQEGFLVVEEILGNDMHFLDKEPGMPFRDLTEDLLVFGIVLPDNRKIENGIYVISSLVFMRDQIDVIRNEIIALAEKSGYETSLEFYKEHMVDVYEILMDRESPSVDQVTETLTPLQQDAVLKLDEVFDSEIDNPEVKFVLKNILVSYIVLQQPNFRKPETLAAAMFQAAYDIGIIPDEMYTKSRIAKLFGVSTASMTKHADAIFDYVLESMAEAEQADTVIATEMD